MLSYELLSNLTRDARIWCNVYSLYEVLLLQGLLNGAYTHIQFLGQGYKFDVLWHILLFVWFMSTGQVVLASQYSRYHSFLFGLVLNTTRDSLRTINLLALELPPLL